MSIRPCPALLLALAACTPSVEQFETEFTPTFCTYAVECVEELPPGTDTGETSTASCEAEITDLIDGLKKDENCTYDGEAAQTCLDSLDGAECSGAENVRDACENIFTGDDCDLNLTALL